MRWIIYISVITLFSLGNALSAQHTILDQEVSVDFSETEIKEVIEYLSDTYDLNFSYSETNVPIHQKASLKLQNVPIKEVLDQLLGAASMSYQLITDQIVLITMMPGLSEKKLYGIVIDKSSNKPIPFASIGIEHSSRGTSSNADGEFLLKIPTLPIKISASHISHDRRTVSLENTQDTVRIYLTQAVKTLMGITVRGKKNNNGLYQMVQKANRQLWNSALSKKYGKAFYRQKSKRDDHFSEIFEIFFDVRYNSNGVEDWEVMEGRYALKNEDDQQIFLYNRNFSLLSRILTLAQPNTKKYLMPVLPEVRKYFNLELFEVFKYGKRNIAVIHYEPKATNEVSSSEGLLYIDTDSFEIIKISGAFDDDSIDILQFSHQKGDWKNFKLTFEISFKEDGSGTLQMDHIKIAHKFDYYHGNEFHGTIQTDSYLVFYEHYTPIERKNLGGKLDMNYSDVQTLDGLGYNRVFWEQNPIVKRTPTEKRVIEEFENSLAFGSVYLDQQQLISYLPKYTTDSVSKVIVKEYFEPNKRQLPDEKIYLRLNQDYAKPGGMIHFNGFVLNFRNHVPSVLSSILNVEIIDANGIVRKTNQFDLDRGAVNGSIMIPHDLEDGEYQMNAYTNRNNSVTFNRRFYLLSRDYYYPNLLNVNPAMDRLFLKIRTSIPLKQPLCNHPTQMSFQISDRKNKPISMQANILDEHYNLVDRIKTNLLGTGLIDYLPGNNQYLYLCPAQTEDTVSIPLPACRQQGIEIKINQTSSKNLLLHVQNKGDTSSYVYIGISKFSLIYHLFKQSISRDRTMIEIPRLSLPSEVFELKVFDMNGDNIYSKQIANPNSKVFQINLISNGRFKRKQNLFPLQFEVIDENGNPVQGHFVISTYARTNAEIPQPEIEMCNFLNLKPILKESYEQYRRPLNELPDTVSIACLNQLLLSYETTIEMHENTGHNNKIIRVETGHDMAMQDQSIEMAELNLAVASGDNSEDIESAPVTFSTWKNTAWIPAVLTDHEGQTDIELKILPDVDDYLLLVEGVSKEGDIVAIKTEINIKQLKDLFSAMSNR